MRLLNRYFIRQFATIFLLCLVGVLMIYLVVDGVENMDGFIDAQAPKHIILYYYIYYIPMIVVLILPVCSLLAAVFSVGNLARNNETVALKALGVSLYQMMRILLILGLLISLVSFLLAEGVVVQANQKKEAIEETYLKKGRNRSQTVLTDLTIQEPPNQVIYIGRFDRNRNQASRVKIETFGENKLVSRIDAPGMSWKDGVWVIESGYRRDFTNDQEVATPITEPQQFRFQFSPDELVMAQSKPEELNILDLGRFIGRIRASGQPVHQWMTDFHLRIAFPLANFFIVLLAAPLSYNRRKQSLTFGFGFALLIVFLYFGMVKLGQTMGHNATLKPLVAAWTGNGIAAILGVINIWKIRK